MHLPQGYGAIDLAVPCPVVSAFWCAVAFLWDIKHWRTLAEFEAHLVQLSAPAWIRGFTAHHTWKPTIDQWRGERSMIALGKVYKGYGWVGGPQLFCAVGSPNPNDDGVWQGTPITEQGVHAGVCNGSHVGGEFVGNFDLRYYTPAEESLFLGVILATLRWCGLPINAGTVKGHRECLPNKTCPGSKIDLPRLRLKLIAMAGTTKPSPTPKPDRWSLWGTKFPLYQNARVFGIPQAWYKQGVAEKLGEARSDEMYCDGFSYIAFQHGIIVYNSTGAHVVDAPVLK